MSDSLNVDSYLRPVVEDDLKRILEWRNHPEIRHFMFDQHEISFAQHCIWFKNASQDVTKRLLIFMQGNTACGFVSFSNISHGSIAEWGFYKAPDAPKGIGRNLGITALKYGFVDIGLHRIYGQTLDFNTPSINLHRMLGFQQEGVFRDQYYNGNSYCSVIYFGLLRSEWAPKLI